MRITANDTLTNIDGRANLSSVSGDCRILEHQALSNIDGLVNLTSVGDYLWIYKNHSLANLDGLANLSNTFSLIIEGNDVLTNLDGLSKLSSVDEALAIRDNASLTNINGLANLTGAVSSLSIIDNEILNNLDSLSGLTMTGSLGVKDHASLKNIDGLANLTGTVAVLRVNGNQALTNVDGLANLTGTETDLEIMGNASLENINGLSSFTRVDQFVKVQMNNSLTQCGGLLRLLDQWDDAEPGPGPGESGVPDVGLTVHMGENLAGCNSIEEVLEDVNTSRINAGLNDAWFNPETEGQGFFISVFPDLGFVSLAWFTYDTELPPDDAQANLGDPGHRWLTALGPIEDNQAVMNIEMTTGGIFDTPTEIQRTDPPGSDGTILLTFTSCNSGTVEYDIPSINRQGMVPVQRVAGDNIALCEVLSTE